MPLRHAPSHPFRILWIRARASFRDEIGDGVSNASGSAYTAWNDALAAHFFSAEMADRPVHLFVTEEVVEEVGRPFGQGFENFIDVIRGGPPGTTRSGHCQRALQVAGRWRSRGYPYPPYLAYLSLFVVAGGHEGDFDPRSYYPRLWELLGENETGTPPSFDQMWELWEDLEDWSVRDKGGELGVFQARAVGGKIHIGLPLAQTVLTETERHALPRIFTDAGLDPGSLPSDRELRRGLVMRGRSALRRQTIAALDGGESSYASALLDVVADEFEDWDGAVPEPSVGTDKRAAVSAALRLCLSVDAIAGVARATLRCLSKKELPDDGLDLVWAPAGPHLTCSAFLPAWSHPLADSETGADFEPPPRVWRDGIVLSSDPSGWSLRARAARLRVLVDGAAQQLPGLVETRRLSRDTRLYLAFPESEWSSLQPWVENECDGWHQIPIARGLPGGWMLGSVERALTDTAVRKIDDDLAFPDRRALRFVGGVRAAAGNAFFEFAPPRAVLDGAMPGDVLVCNEEELAENSIGSGEHALPAGLPLDTRLTLEARNDEEIVARRSLYIVTGFPWRIVQPLAEFDGAGIQVPVGTGIAGAAVPDMQSGQHPPDLLRTPGLNPAAPCVYFVGRRPDEIALWPKDPVPDWDPVWAIPFGRRGRALYCGESLTNASPLAGRRANRPLARMRHQVLWRWRARITPPQDRSLKTLWKHYSEAARDG
jgi:hypothetical protein